MMGSENIIPSLCRLAIHSERVSMQVWPGRTVPTLFTQVGRNNLTKPRKEQSKMRALRLLIIIAVFLVVSAIVGNVVFWIGGEKASEVLGPPPGPNATPEQNLAYMQELSPKLMPFLYGGAIAGLVAGYVAARIASNATKGWRGKET
jgi:hypothetical protein